MVSLIPPDSYESEKVGGLGGGGPHELGGDGSPVLGIVGKMGQEHASGLGLLLGPQPLGREPTIVSGGFAPMFKDVAPKGGLLIGLETGLGEFGREDVKGDSPDISSGWSPGVRPAARNATSRTDHDQG